MALQLTLSCDSDKTEIGPTLIHSTGVEDYKIPPEIIAVLQENLTNDFLSDHEDGVLCQENPQRVLDILRQSGFTLQNESNDEQKVTWTVVKETSGDGEQPANPEDADSVPTENNEADAAGENNDGNDEAENKEDEEQQQEQADEGEE